MSIISRVPALAVLASSRFVKSSAEERLGDLCTAYIACQKATLIGTRSLAYIFNQFSRSVSVKNIYLDHFENVLGKKAMSFFNFLREEDIEYCQAEKNLASARTITRIFKYYKELIRSWDVHPSPWQTLLSAAAGLVPLLCDFPMTLDHMTEIALRLPSSRIESIKNMLRSIIPTIDNQNDLSGLYTEFRCYLMSETALDTEKIKQIFVTAAYFGHTEIVSILMKSTSFTAILDYGGYTLGEALCSAAEKGHTEIVGLLMEDTQRFAAVSADGINSLGYALCWAIQAGHTEIVGLLMENERFKEISLNGDYSLSSALEVAARFDFREIIVKLLKNARLAEIPANGINSLGYVLCRAAETGRTEIVGLLMKNAHFAKIPAGGWCSLGDALCRAAQAGHIGIVSLLMKNERFKEILPGNISFEGDDLGEYSLGDALLRAAQAVHIGIVSWLLWAPRAVEIPPLIMQDVVKAMESWKIESVLKIK